MSESGSVARNRRRASQQTKAGELPLTITDAELLEDEEENKKGKEIVAPQKFSFLCIVILVGICTLFAKYMDGRLPKALVEEDILNNTGSFIEERARKDLHTLTKVGVRVAGSNETDVITVANFGDILDKIVHETNYVHNVEWEVQRASGAFFMDSDEGHTSTYTEIANVIAKIEPADVFKRSNNSFMVNCHFDTKPGSPGATDNMISCAVMLESLRVLSKQESPLRNTIVFLFNGAEELGLQGAHAFVNGTEGTSLEMGHKWSRNVKAFANLEGAGAGGREILFQTGPGNSWVLNAYCRAVPYPYGNVLGEEAFQLGLVPSDTDFRIFRDFKDIPGLDMAFIKNGWVYHTKWDKLIEIPPGSIQHMGANALALMKEFGNLDLQTEQTDGKFVFFDVLGGFMIRYSEVVGIVINVVVGAATLISIYLFDVHRKMKIQEIVLLPVATIVSWGLGIGAAVLVALFLNGCGYVKPFYSYPSLSFVVFGIPAILAQTISFSFILKGSETKTWVAGKVVTAIITIAMTFVTRAVYVFTINLLFAVVARLLSRWACRGWPRGILATYLVIGEVIPFLLSSYILITLADIFVPIMGRSGSETNANLFFGLIVAAFVSVLLFNGLTSVFVTYKKTTLIICFLLSFFLLNPMIVFGFIGKVPYQEKTPMRLNIVELDRTWYAPDMVTVEKTEGGYWFWTLDSNTEDFIPTFMHFVEDMKNITDFDVDSNACPDLYCAQPFLWPATELIKKTHWIPKDKGLPHLKEEVKMVVTVNETLGNLRRMTFVFSGPTQLTIVLSPDPSYKLTNWSLTTSIPPSGVKWRDRPTYFIYQSRGSHIRNDFEFSCEFSGGPSDGPVVDVLLAGFYLYGDNLASQEFREFSSLFPYWTNIMDWSTVLKMYKLY